MSMQITYIVTIVWLCLKHLITCYLNISYQISNYWKWKLLFMFLCKLSSIFSKINNYFLGHKFWMFYKWKWKWKMKCYEHFLNNIIRAHIISCDYLSMIIFCFLSISLCDTGIYTTFNSEWFVTWSHAISNLGRWLLQVSLGVIKLQTRF
jgi:hypothetical protein